MIPDRDHARIIVHAMYATPYNNQDPGWFNLWVRYVWFAYPIASLSSKAFLVTSGGNRTFSVFYPKTIIIDDLRVADRFRTSVSNIEAIMIWEIEHDLYENAFMLPNGYVQSIITDKSKQATSTKRIANVPQTVISIDNTSRHYDI